MTIRALAVIAALPLASCGPPQVCDGTPRPSAEARSLAAQSPALTAECRARAAGPFMVSSEREGAKLACMQAELASEAAVQVNLYDLKLKTGCEP